MKKLPLALLILSASCGTVRMGEEGRKVGLIFELSEKGRKGYRLPKLDVPAVDVTQYLGEYYRENLNFPEVSEL
jgi:hypothetical protein